MFGDAIIDVLKFLIFNCLFLVYNNTTDFSMLISYLATLLNSLTDF